MPRYTGPTFVPADDRVRYEQRLFDDAVKTVPLPSAPYRVKQETDLFDAQVGTIPLPSQEYQRQQELTAFDEAVKGLELPSQTLMAVDRSTAPPERLDLAGEAPPSPSASPAGSHPAPSDPIVKTLNLLGLQDKLTRSTPSKDDDAPQESLFDRAAPEIPAPPLLTRMGAVLTPPIQLGKPNDPSQEDHERASQGRSPIETVKEGIDHLSEFFLAQNEATPGAVGEVVNVGAGAAKRARLGDALAQGVDGGSTLIQRGPQYVGNTLSRGLDETQNIAGQVGNWLLDLEPGTLGRAGETVERGVKAAGDVVGQAAGAVGGAARRFYHGTGSAFDKPDPGKFDPNGLFGPGYYLTSDPRVASGYADERAIALPLDAETKRRAVQLRRQAEAAFDEWGRAKDAAYADPSAANAAAQEAAWKRATELSAQATRVASERPRAGQQVRAIDAPEDLDLLDADAPITPEMARRIDSALPDVMGVESSQESGQQWLSEGYTAADVYESLWAIARQQTGEMGAMSGKAPEAKALVNDLLSVAGFDGIKYAGGKRIPITDDAGNAIEHDAYVVFPRALPKIRNAISGTPMGGFAAGVEPETDEQGNITGVGVDPLKGALGAAGMTAATSPRGRQALENAGQTARRFFHGTGSAFDTPDPKTFDPTGMYGPAYYVTSDSRVAGSYASVRAADKVDPAVLREQVDLRRQQLEQWSAALDDLPPDGAMRRQGESGLRAAQARLLEAEQELREAERAYGGPNMRAIDVPDDLNLFDVDAKAKPEDVQAIRQALLRLGEQGEYTRMGEPDPNYYLRQFVAKLPAANPTNQHLYDGLAEAFSYLEGDKKLRNREFANVALSTLGYDGVRYGGGKRIPIADDAGKPIEHEALAIFPQALPKIRNAISGAPGGIVDALTQAVSDVKAPAAENVAGALSGAAGSQAFAEEDETLGERIGRAVGGGFLGAAGVRGVRRALRGQNPLALDTGITQESGIRGPGFYRPQQAQQQQLPMALPPPRPTVDNWDRAMTLRRAAMLSGTMTHVINNASNLVNLVLDIGGKVGQAGADAAVSRATGKPRERYLAEVGPQVMGTFAGILDGAKEIPRVLVHGLPSTAVGKTGPGGFQSGNRAADAFVDMPLRLVEAADVMWRQGAFAGHAAALATRQATREGLSGTQRAQRARDILQHLDQHPKIAEEAQRAAKRVVFQEERPELDPLLKAQRGKGKYLMDVLLPFVRTPYNVAAQGVAMSPLGLASAVRRAKAGETGPAIDSAVRALAGTAVMGLGYAFAEGGYLTGAYPESRTDSSTLPPGWKPYSIRIPADDGAVYVPIVFLGPLAVPLGAAAILHDAAREGQRAEAPDKLIARTVAAVAKFVGDQAFLQGIETVVRATEARTAAGAIERFTEGLASSFHPYSALMGQVQQALGMAPRDPKGALEALLAVNPLTAGNVRERMTPMGGTQERPSGPAAFVTGNRIGVEMDEPTLRVLRAARVGIPSTDDQYEGYKLSRDEQDAITRRAGAYLREELAPLDGSPAASDAKLVRKKRDRALDRARNEVLGPVKSTRQRFVLP